MDRPRAIKAVEGGIRAKWSDAGHLRSEFASELNIVHAGGQFVLTFGELRLPIFAGPVPSNVEGEVRPVVRLVIPEQSIETMLVALTSVAQKIKKNPTK